MTGKLSRLLSRAPRTEEFKKPEITRWALFKAVFSKRKLNMCVLSVIGALGAAFGVIIYLNRSASITSQGLKLPFSGNLGIGYPVSLGMDKAAALELLKTNFTFFTFLIPAIVVFALFLSGIFYAVKKMAFEELGSVNAVKEFWVGFKKNVTNFLTIAFLLAGVIFLAGYARIGVMTMQINNGISFFSVLLTILIYAVAILYGIMSLYMMTLSVSYKMNILQLIKNSFFLTFGMLIRNLLFFVLTFCPIALALIPGASIVALLYFGLFGIAVSVLTFTLYSDWVFERVGLNSQFVEFESQSVTVEKNEKHSKLETSDVNNDYNIEDRGTDYNKNQKRKNVYANPKKKKK